MPNGYTSEIYDGTNTDPADYLRRVARAFGAYIHFRDSAITDRLPELPTTLPEDAYERRSLAEAEAELARLRGLTEPEAIAEFERDRERFTIDVAKAVEAIAKATPQAVVMVTLYKPTAAFVKAMKKIGQNPMLSTLSPVGAEQMIQELGADARGIVVSQVVPYPWNNVVPVVRDYQKLSEKQQFSYYGLEGYIMARTLVEGLKRIKGEITPEALLKALETVDADLGGFKVRFSPNNRIGSSYIDVTLLRGDGQPLVPAGARKIILRAAGPVGQTDLTWLLN